jgi:hypothetical protein
MVAFLFSDDGAYVNGQTILVDGGRQFHVSEPPGTTERRKILPNGRQERGVIRFLSVCPSLGRNQGSDSVGPLT